VFFSGLSRFFFFFFGLQKFHSQALTGETPLQ